MWLVDRGDKRVVVRGGISGTGSALAEAAAGEGALMAAIVVPVAKQAFLCHSVEKDSQIDFDEDKRASGGISP